MWIEGLKWIGTMFLGYLAIGYVWSWIWLFEARIKCMDMKIKAWEDYLNSLSGIFSFQFLCTLFWMPVLLSRVFRNARRRKFHKLKIMFQRTFEIWDLLFDLRINKEKKYLK